MTNQSKQSRREFLKAAAGVAGAASALACPAVSYSRILGANDRVRVGVAGFGNWPQQCLLPAFQSLAANHNFELVAVSDVVARRREEGVAFLQQLAGRAVAQARDNHELFGMKDVDAVIIATADLQHALHGIEAVCTGRHAYIETPLAHTVEDAQALRKAVEETGKTVQIGTQRRSGARYTEIRDRFASGRFGDLSMVEIVRNTSAAGTPGEEMIHRIDTLHWFTDYDHPRSVVAGGGVYPRPGTAAPVDSLTAVLDYGPRNDREAGFRAVYTNRTGGSAEMAKEVYRSSTGAMDLVSEVAAPGRESAEAMVQAHLRNWMECIRSGREPNAGVRAGFGQSVTLAMVTTALETGKRVTFDTETREIVVGQGQPGPHISTASPN